MEDQQLRLKSKVQRLFLLREVHQSWWKWVDLNGWSRRIRYSLCLIEILRSSRYSCFFNKLRNKNIERTAWEVTNLCERQSLKQLSLNKIRLGCGKIQNIVEGLVSEIFKDFKDEEIIELENYLNRVLRNSEIAEKKLNYK